MNWLKVGLLLGLAASILLSLNLAYRWGTCEWYGHQTSRETKVAPFLGCLVKSGGHWIPRSEIRTTAN